MNRHTNHRPRGKRSSGVDKAQIIEALRLTPTQRLEKAWRYSAFALELRRATEIGSRVAKPG